MKKFSPLKEDLRKWFNPSHPEGGWKRINSKGEAIGPCAREPGEPKPKCMSNAKRAALTKKERAAAVKAKRKHDPNPERKGEPINVSNFGKGKLSEQMKNLNEKNEPTSPEKWARAKAMAKQKFDVYPSAYANGWAAKKYKEMGGEWKTVSEEQINELSKSTLQSYMKKAEDDASRLDQKVKDHPRRVRTGDDARKIDNRRAGIVDARMRLRKMKEEVEQIDEVSTAQMSHQGKTTLKHIKNPGVELRMAAHDIKPGVAGYRDRIDLLKAAKAQGKLKEQSDVFKNIRFAKNTRVGKNRIDVHHAGPSTDDEEHYTVGTVEFAQQLKHAKKRAMQESEQINEISKDLARSYYGKAQSEVRATEPYTKKGEYKDIAKNLIARRKKGIEAAKTRIRKEEVQLDEIAPLAAIAARVIGGMAGRAAAGAAARKGATIGAQKLAGAAGNVAGRYGTYKALNTDKEDRQYNEQVQARKAQIVKDIVNKKKSEKFEPNPELSDRNSPEV